MQLFYGPTNKQKDRALDTRNSNFRCMLKPYVYLFIFINVKIEQACILSFSSGLPKLLITKKKLPSVPLSHQCRLVLTDITQIFRSLIHATMWILSVDEYKSCLSFWHYLGAGFQCQHRPLSQLNLPVR